MSTIPETETISGDSFGRIIQLSTAPETGIKNFQILSSETFTVGRRSNVFQIEIAAAERKLSQANATKYSGGKTLSGIPSSGSETAKSTNPPINKEAEVRTKGEMVWRFRAITTFEIPETKLLRIRRTTPVNAISAPDGKLLRPNVMTATPKIPRNILPDFDHTIRSSETKKWATSAINKGDEPTIIADMEAGNKLIPV